MIKRLISKLKTINPWHFLWITILFSEGMGLILNTIQSYLWWGYLSRDLLLIGLIDGLFVPLLVAPVVIYFVRKNAELEKLAKELQITILKVKESEGKKLRESQALYRSIVEDQTEFINRFLPDFTVLFVNEAACRYFNVSHDEFVGRNFLHLLPPEDQIRLKELVFSLTPENPSADIEHRVIAPDGSICWNQWTNRALFDGNGNLVQFQAVGRDITRIKQAELALRESEARLRKISDNLPFGLVYQIDSGEDGRQRRFSYISAGVEQLHGITVTEAMKDAMTIYGQIIEEDRQRVAEEEAFALANMLPFKTEARVQLPSGEIKWIFFSSAPRRFTDNHLLWDGVEIDITERKQLEYSLRESEDRFRIALSNSPIVIFNQDTNLRYTWIYNPRGFSTDDVIGKTDSDFYDLESIDQLIEIKRRVLESGTAIKKEVMLKRGNETFYYDCMFEPLYDSDGNIKGINGVAIDITKRKEDEELIRSYQHQLGRLISQLTTVEERSKRNVAVDLHDNIGQTLACANMMLGELHKSSAGNISKAIDEVRRLIEQIIIYTRSLTFELGNPLLYEIGLEVALERLGKDFQKKHGLKFSFEDDRQPKPLKDETRILLFQTVRELTTNVVKHARAQILTISLARKDNMIEVAVKDDGTGFDSSGIKKELVIKSGFGIFSIRERMKHIGGSISISSEPGAGTMVTLTAPLETS